MVTCQCSYSCSRCYQGTAAMVPNSTMMRCKPARRSSPSRPTLARTRTRTSLRSPSSPPSCTRRPSRPPSAPAHKRCSCGRCLAAGRTCSQARCSSAPLRHIPTENESKPGFKDAQNVSQRCVSKRVESHRLRPRPSVAAGSTPATAVSPPSARAHPRRLHHQTWMRRQIHG